MARVVVLGSCPKALYRFRRHLLYAMIQRNHEVFACAPDEDPDTVRQLEAMGVQYQPVKLHRTSLNPAYDIATAYHLTRLFRRLRPEVALGYTIKPVIYGSLAARQAGVPHIFSMVEGLGYVFSGRSSKRRFLAMIAGRLYQLAFRFNERVFVLNSDDAEFFRSKGIFHRPDQCVILPGIGVDLKHFTPTPLPAYPSFLLIGRLLRDKGIHEYVEAARILKARHPDASFRLAGSIDKNPTAIKPSELSAWQAEGIIEYLGELPDVRPAIADASVQVLPSYREGMPVSIMEAMAMGRAIVTTDAPGCRETVQEGVNGYLVPVGSPSMLAAAMERFIVEPEQIATHGKASRKLAEERFDVHKVNKILLKTMHLY